MAVHGGILKVFTSSFCLYPFYFPYAPAGCTLADGVVVISLGFILICSANPAAIIAITPPERKANW